MAANNESPVNTTSKVLTINKYRIEEGKLVLYLQEQMSGWNHEEISYIFNLVFPVLQIYQELSTNQHI